MHFLWPVWHLSIIWAALLPSTYILSDTPSAPRRDGERFQALAACFQAPGSLENSGTVQSGMAFWGFSPPKQNFKNSGSVSGIRRQGIFGISKQRQWNDSGLA